MIKHDILKFYVVWKKDDMFVCVHFDHQDMPVLSAFSRSEILRIMNSPNAYIMNLSEYRGSLISNDWNKAEEQQLNFTTCKYNDFPVLAENKLSVIPNYLDTARYIGVQMKTNASGKKVVVAYDKSAQQLTELEYPLTVSCSMNNFKEWKELSNRVPIIIDSTSATNIFCDLKIPLSAFKRDTLLKLTRLRELTEAYLKSLSPRRMRFGRLVYAIKGNELVLIAQMYASYNWINACVDKAITLDEVFKSWVNNDLARSYVDDVMEVIMT